MIRRLKLWWYHKALEGAQLDMSAKELEWNEARHRVAVYKYRIRQLSES